MTLLLSTVDTQGSPDSRVLTIMSSDGWGQQVSSHSHFAPFDLIYIPSDVSQVGELSFWAWSLSHVVSPGWVSLLFSSTWRPEQPDLADYISNPLESCQLPS